MSQERLSPGHLAQLACILEVRARKPGNVYPGAAFEDTHDVDFLLSASVIADPLNRAATEGVGSAVLRAVDATRRVVSTNTNLGMILLLAPLAAVADGVEPAVGVATVLAATTLDDARAVYRAIRRARPGGLGSVPEQDVAGEPTATLLEVMRLAAHRDLVARQYANAFTEVFDLALPALRTSLQSGHALETAIVNSYLTLLAHMPDTLIARKLGDEPAQEATRQAAQVLAEGWPDSEAGRTLCARFDTWLRAEGHARNPGATADLTTAAIFLALRDGTIRLPRAAGPLAWCASNI